jgi:hypothetical protein
MADADATAAAHVLHHTQSAQRLEADVARLAGELDQARAAMAVKEERAATVARIGAQNETAARQREVEAQV